MSGDLISRQAVLDRKYVVEVKNIWHMTEEIEVVNVDDIKALPPVNPQEPKTDGANRLKCPECGSQYTYQFAHCPTCGAIM